MVSGREVGGHDLGQVAPLRQEDDQEHRTTPTVVRGHPPSPPLLVIVPWCLHATNVDRAEDEHDGDHPSTARVGGGTRRTPPRPTPRSRRAPRTHPRRRATPGRGRPLGAITSVANMVLSGSSPRKITGKTATTTANCNARPFCRATERRRAGAPRRPTCQRPETWGARGPTGPLPDGDAPIRGARRARQGGAALMAGALRAAARGNRGRGPPEGSRVPVAPGRGWTGRSW